MINKFQQGGKQDAIMLFVLGLAETLQADPNQIIQIAQLNPDALKNAVQVYQLTQDMGQAAQAFLQALQQQVQAAKHGAKLNYLKSLKRQCADDEQLVYYKKGGSVDCGCVKKQETGGKTEKENSPVSKFKAIKKAKDGEKIARKITDTIGFATGTLAGINRARKEKGKNVVVNGSTKKPMEDAQRPKFRNDYSSKRVKDSEEDYMKGTADHKVKKNCGGSKMKLVKKGGEVCPKCGKIHKAGIGCAIAKFKAYRLGGSI